jgi:hypothetical protein
MIPWAGEWLDVLFLTASGRSANHLAKNEMSVITQNMLAFDC